MATRSALITGCSTGIGRCLAEGLHALGYRVFATARKPGDVDELNRIGLESLQLDLDDSHSIQQAVETILERTGGELYALINNGAWGQPGAVEDLGRDLLRKQFETNLFGTQELTNLVLPAMRKQGFGRIVQISSILGITAMAYRGAYNASKFALEGLSDTMRLELRDTNIHVVLIEPGPIVSNFRNNAYAAFKANIDAEHSSHRDRYRNMVKRFKGEAGKTPFTLPPEAVLVKTIKALEAKRPKIRYGVTVPTHVFGLFKRILPFRWLDAILAAAGGDGKR
ncbi:MAG: SDR family NAD(P)-dependent oxidoreductase [Acidiferrobacterales bacterium]|nr:SDR family NAD(P)-dependent oxidoreductase [Acidiferrobacterales bacterium]